MIFDPKVLVAKGYDAIAERYACWTAGSRQREYWLDRLSDRLSPHSLILDLGCGNGMVARRLTGSGHDVVGIDISSKQIELARRNAPDAKFLLGDIATCPFAASLIDAAIVLYSITHVPRQEHAALLRAVARCLKPRGWLLASMGVEDTDEWRGSWLGTEMFFSHFDAKTNATLIANSGFITERSGIVGEEEDGKLVEFLWILASKS